MKRTVPALIDIERCRVLPPPGSDALAQLASREHGTR